MVVEITKELFYTIVQSDTPNTEVISKEAYTDVVYIVEGTTLFRRSQQSGANYYIKDINQ